MREEFPEEGELVVATVKKVLKYGAFVTLDEYPGLEAYLPISEISTGWVRNIRDYVQEGRKIVAKVIVVDPAKKKIDVSMKRVSPSQRRMKMQLYQNQQRAIKLLERVATLLGKDPKRFLETVGERLMDEYGHLYAAFEEAVVNEAEFRKKHRGDWVDTFIQVAKQNVPPPEVKIKRYIYINVPGPDGVEHIKEALSRLERDGKVSIAVKYMGAPKYMVIVKAPNYKVAERTLNEAFLQAKEIVRKAGGTMELMKE